MNIKEAVVAALKELVLPELALLKQDQAELKTTLALTNKRLDDMNVHLVDQSRRIDAIREDLGGRIDAIREELTDRIIQTNQRIDAVREELTGRIDALRTELSEQISETNNRLNRLYEVIVRREEHHQLNERVMRLEHDMEDLKRRLAA